MELSHDSVDFAWGPGHTEGPSRDEVLKPQKERPDTRQPEATGLDPQYYLTEKPRHRSRL